MNRIQKFSSQLTQIVSRTKFFLAMVFVGLGASGPLLAGKETAQTWQHTTLTDEKGKETSLSSLIGKKGTAIVFLSFECPISRDYCRPLAELSKKHPEIAFIGLVESEDDTRAQIAKYASEFELPFPLFKDEGHRVATALKATVTPEVCLFDKAMTLQYQGRIDNTYAARLRKNRQTTQHDLRDALLAVEAGKAVTQARTEAIGCPIVCRETVAGGRSGVTYHKEVLPILQKNCQQCHRPGEAAPFALMTYRQAANWAGDIKAFTQAGKMPPWKPTAGAAFHNERKLTNEELATLSAWVDAGAPEGDPKDAPPPRKFTPGWQLGEPDLVLTVASDYHLGPNGRDVFRCFVLPTNLTESKDVVAVEMRPGNSRVVHHVLTAIDTRGRGRQLEEAARQKESGTNLEDHGPGYSASMGFGFLPEGSLSGWAPGQIARFLPEGTGYHLPKGSDIILQVHYHRNGRPQKDRCSIGLYFAKKPIEKRYRGMVLRGAFLIIPAGAADYRVQGQGYLTQDITLYNVMPHMHMLGKEIEVTLTPPDGKPQTLVAIKDWDYNWQETYVLKEPIQVKAGTRFEVKAVFDNSSGNPNNPNSPPRRVRFGEQTTDEMCFVFLGTTSDKPGRPRLTPLAPKAAK